MGCPTQCVLSKNLTFTVQTYDGTGAPVAATGNVSYSVYEDETATAILTDTMTQLASKTGFYSEQIACTTANGFEQFKTYTIRITATVSSISVAKTYSFICVGIEDTVSGTTTNLTTTANFKSYIGKTDSDDDTLIGQLVSRASKAIKNFCNRNFNSDTYRHRFNGDGGRDILLKDWPITAVQLVSTQIADGLRVTNSSSDAWNAYLTVTDTDENSTGITLEVQGGANDGSNSIAFTSRGDYTLTTLAAAITALGGGWTAAADDTNLAKYDAMELLPCMGLQCLDNSTYVQVPYEPQLDYRVYGERGVITVPSGTPGGRLNVVVRYTAGWSTIPNDLEQIAIDLVNVYWRRRTKDMSVKSERLGDHAITMADGSFGDIPKVVEVRLAPYKNWNTGL